MKNKKLQIAGLLGLLSLLLMGFTAKQMSHVWKAKKAFQRSKAALQQAAHAPQTLKNQAQELATLQKEMQRQHETIRSGVKLLSEIEAACRAQGITLLSLPQERLIGADESRLSEVRFSVQGRLQDILTLSHRWEYEERLGRLAYFKLAREQIRKGRRKEVKLIASLRFQRLL